MDIWTVLGSCAAVIWLAVAVLPWQPHRTRERIGAADTGADLGEITVVIPARNEADCIGRCLAALEHQGDDLHVIVVDDQSEDATAPIAREFAKSIDGVSASLSVDVVRGVPPPSGWGGKLWALQQGLDRVVRPYCMLLDADIVLAPHTIPAVLLAARREGAALVSVMARLNCSGVWERLLVPPFIFFFKLLYPFALVARRSSGVAAAAGGCVLVRTAVLREVGAFDAWCDALIDDCSLAKHVKKAGHNLRLYLSDDVMSIRRYDRLSEFWRMVTRTAYTQLGYSLLLLLATTLVMFVVFMSPILAVALAREEAGVLAGALALAAMTADFWPVSRFYRTPVPWRASLPIAAALFLAMTWHSAINYYTGNRATWKARRYDTPR
jgi:hopene-associated glycosyltransferase HpnB